nr:hypothetical protein [Micromonospora maritima]
MSSIMRAVVLREFASPLRVDEIDRPATGVGQALVRIVASGVNPLDTKIQAGQAPHARVRPPAVLGLDLAGQKVPGRAGSITGRSCARARHLPMPARCVRDSTRAASPWTPSGRRTIWSPGAPARARSSSTSRPEGTDSHQGVNRPHGR